MNIRICATQHRAFSIRRYYETRVGQRSEQGHSAQHDMEVGSDIDGGHIESFR